LLFKILFITYFYFLTNDDIKLDKFVTNTLRH
jgi:hypothetical protein